MRKKYKIVSTLVIALGLVIGWNVQNKQIAEALIGTNILISRSSSGVRGNGDSLNVDISLDGRYAVFDSTATNLVSGDTNGVTDIFLKDTVTNNISRVSVDSSGNQANANSGKPKISGNGKYIVYYSSATNLVSSDTNGYADIFRYTVATGITERVSVDSSGNQANQQSYDADLDTEGRFIVFTTQSSNLGMTDTNSENDVVLKDMTSGSVTYISQSDAGVIGNSYSSSGRISCDGRYVIFTSNASNLVPSDSNGYYDAFLTDMLGTRTVTNITLGGNGWSTAADISCNGNYVLFTSNASNLITGDTNAVADAFRYEKSTGTKTRVSVKEDGTAPLQYSNGVAISADGKLAIFRTFGGSFFTNTAVDHSLSYYQDDYLIRDMTQTGSRVIAVKADLNAPIHGVSGNAAFSGSNRIAYDSKGAGLVSDDNNAYIDSFIVDLGPANTCIIQF
jgi:hypothetical protein